MIKSFGEIDNDLINEVCKCFEINYNFDSLRDNYPFLDYSVLYSILYSTTKYHEEIYNYLCQANIDDGKIIVISDTHYGSKYENMKYTYEAFNFAIANGIHIILHGGDIIESNVKPRKWYDNDIKQAEYFINRYPFDNGIKTYAILGNHDYSAINENEVVRDILCSRKDINVLGFRKAYLKWCETVISLQHEIEKFKLNLPINAEYISFKGHSHFYHIREKKNRKNERIYIPSMCEIPSGLKNHLYIKENNIIVKPGFLTAEIDGSNIVIINYSFTAGKIIKENEFTKVLKRKIDSVKESN